MLPRTRCLIWATMTYPPLQRSGIIQATTWEGTTMPLTFRLNVQAQEGTLRLTDRAGKTVTFSKEQTVQQKVSMITLGELCGLPKRQLATCFGFKTRKSYYDIRHAVLNGSSADLLPKRPGPPTPSKRTKEGEARIIRTRFETARTREAIAEALTQRGFTVSARLVGQVLADSGRSKKHSGHPHLSRHGSSPKKRWTASMGPASRAHVSSPATTSRMMSPLCAHAG